MWRAWVDRQLRVQDELRGQLSGGGDRDDLVVVTVDDQRWDIELLEVLGERSISEKTLMQS